MYETILVPLDGSEAAETSLPYVRELSLKLGAELVLLGVAEPGYPIQHILQVYLDEQTVQLTQAGIKARPVVVDGEPAPVILDYASENKVGLIIMGSRGQSANSRWGMGSVSEKVLRGTEVPLLVIQPHPWRKVQKPVAVKKILVPLDGSALGEACLGQVTGLAMKLSAEVVLYHVLPVYDKTGLTPRQVRLALAMREMEAYLSKIATSLENKGLSVSTAVRAGRPAEKILNFARRYRLDIIAMSTHGRGGLGRWALGSLAHKVLHGASRPVLLVRAGGALKAGGILGDEKVKQCQNCGAVIRQKEFTTEDRCYRCDFYLRACANCVFHDGIRCIMQRPEAVDIYAGNRCPAFQFAESSLTLR